MNNPFDKVDYKFGTEGILSMYLDTYQLILGADLESYSKVENETFSDKNPCHIYFILKRPKVTINPDSFKSKGKEVKFDFIIHQQDGYGVVNLGAEFPMAKSKLELITEYPYNLFAITEKQKTHLVARPSTLIDNHEISNNIDPEILNYEVLYIGQAYGKNGKRTALKRLFAHETLQKIYTHSLTQNPESDIWIMLTSFSQVNMLLSIGNNDAVPKIKTDKRNKNLIEHFFENKGFKISEHQKINFTEAALIKYFEPAYNLDYKKNFPDKKHKSYSECYKLNIRALNIELDTSEHIRNIFSKKAGSKNNHSAMFNFENDSERISFLDMYQ